MAVSILSSLEFYEQKLSDIYESAATSGLLSSPTMVFDEMAPLIDPQRHKTVLDIGAGTGLSSLPYHRLGLEITGLDGSAAMLRQFVDKNYAKTLICHDLDDPAPLPIPTASFDIVICNAVRYLVCDAERLLQEMVRVTRPGGLIGDTFETGDMFGYRLNDAGRDAAGSPQCVQTFQHDPADVRAQFEKAGARQLFSADRLAYINGEGRPVHFEVGIYRKQGGPA